MPPPPARLPSTAVPRPPAPHAAAQVDAPPAPDPPPPAADALAPVEAPPWASVSAPPAPAPAPLASVLPRGHLNDGQWGHEPIRDRRISAPVPVQPRVPGSGRTGPRVPTEQLLRDRAPLVPVLKRKRRHPFRAAARFLVVVALIGGAGFGSWYLVEARTRDATWAPDVAELADRVAADMGLAWDHPVQVEALSAPEYADRFAGWALSVDGGNVRDREGEWRALGLMEGPLELLSIGRVAGAYRPAYYDDVAGVVYERAGLPKQLRDVALGAALAEAILAQQPGGRLPPVGTSAALAARIVARSDAAATAARLAAADPAAAKWATGQAADLVDVETASVMAPPRYALDMMIADSGFTPVMTRLEDPAERAAMRGLRPASDAALLDLARSISSVPAPVATEAGVQRGMVYWYYALASRLPSDEAWRAATAWNGDQVVVTRTPTGVCVDAELAAIDQDGRVVLLDALQRWADTAPPEAAAGVAQAGERIQVHACDPGPGADVVTNFAIAPFGSAPEERRLLTEMGAATDGERRCAALAVRGYGVVEMLRAGDDVRAAEAMAGIAGACLGIA